MLARTGGTSRPLHHLLPEELLERLAEESLFAEITHAIMESLVSKNGARLRVMENADRNISDKVDELRHLEHTLHQEAITSELLDLVTGAEAMLSADRSRQLRRRHQIKPKIRMPAPVFRLDRELCLIQFHGDRAAVAFDNVHDTDETMVAAFVICAKRKST